MKKKPTRNWLLVLALAGAGVTLSLALYSQAPTTVEFAALEAAARDEMAKAHVPGLAIAIVRGDEVVYQKGFGVANLETGDPVTPDTLFQIGSVTKLFTAAALVDLAESGALDLHQPIGRYLVGLSPLVAEMTGDQLLSQTSGLRDQPGDYGTHGEADLTALARSLTDADRFLPPGRVFSYSNLGYALAGAALQEIAGKPYADVMAARIFEPLGMTRTTLRPTSAMTYTHAVGHETRDGRSRVVRPIAEDTRLWPAGYMFSSASDLSRFARVFLNQGRLDGRPALPPAVVGELSKPRVPMPNLFENAQYGYGLMMYPYRGVQLLTHDGTTPGFAASIRFVPAHRFALVVLANEGTTPFRRTADAAMEAMLPLDPPAPPTTRKPQPLTAAEAAKYTGTYRNRWNVTLAATEDGLTFQQDTGPVQRVVRIGESRFMVLPPGAPRGPEFVLGVGNDGRPEYLHMFLWGFKRVE